MIALRYGTVPVVRETGGLADSVMDYQPMTERGTCFVFHQYDPTALAYALGRALEVYRMPDQWRGLQQQGMRYDLSWTSSAGRYVDAYREAQEIHRAGR